MSTHQLVFDLFIDFMFQLVVKVEVLLHAPLRLARWTWQPGTWLGLQIACAFLGWI